MKVDFKSTILITTFSQTHLKSAEKKNWVSMSNTQSDDDSSSSSFNQADT